VQEGRCPASTGLGFNATATVRANERMSITDAFALCRIVDIVRMRMRRMRMTIVNMI